MFSKPRKGYQLEEDQDLLYYELYNTIQQKPNKKFFGIRPSIWFHYTFDTLKIKRKRVLDSNKQEYKLDTFKVKNIRDNRFRKWLRESIGKAPVFYDSTRTERSRLSMLNKLFHKGYYDAKVEVEVSPKKSYKHKK